MTSPFLLLSEADHPEIQNLVEEAVRQATRPLGFTPHLLTAPLPQGRLREASAAGLLDTLKRLASEGAAEIFLLPFSPEFGLLEREMLAHLLTDARRATGAAIHYDEGSFDHLLVVQALAERAQQAAAAAGLRADRTGVVVAAAGEGDTKSRAVAYSLMRQIWETAGFTAGEVGFLRHAHPFLRAVLERIAPQPLDWVAAPLELFPGERHDHLAQIVDDHNRVSGMRVILAEPAGPHPALAAWIAHRMVALWREKRQRESVRTVSARRVERNEPRRTGDRATGLIAEVRDAAELRAILPEPVLDAARVLVKVTWHGYAPGSYTDPAALDLLAQAIPGRLVLVEGHTSSRNLGGAEFDWETEARAHRTWIREQEAEFLRRTGLAEVIARHRMQYLNVTESVWDGAVVPVHEIQARLGAAGIALHHEKLMGFVPSALADLTGSPMLSFARFKGPTRLTISNLFGLLPDPLRSAWHGPDIRYMARVCCEIAKLYGTLFPLYGLVEGVFSALKWDRQGLYRSRWGNYDLIAAPGLCTFSEGLSGADALAARLQGHDPSRSAFFDTVKEELSLPIEALNREIPSDWLQLFA